MTKLSLDYPITIIIIIKDQFKIIWDAKESKEKVLIIIPKPVFTLSTSIYIKG